MTLNPSHAPRPSNASNRSTYTRTHTDTQIYTKQKILHSNFIHFCLSEWLALVQASVITRMCAQLIERQFIYFFICWMKCYVRIIRIWFRADQSNGLMHFEIKWMANVPHRKRHWGLYFPISQRSGERERDPHPSKTLFNNIELHRCKWISSISIRTDFMNEASHTKQAHRYTEIKGVNRHK